MNAIAATPGQPLTIRLWADGEIDETARDQPEEIAILRVKLRELIHTHPDRLDLHFEAANTIARLVRTRYSITREQKKTLREAITKVLTDIAVPLGIKALIK